MSFLYDYQYKAVQSLKDGNILVGSVGSGKSRTGLYYYFKEYDGNYQTADICMKNPANLLIITTARKRDLCEWDAEMAPFQLSRYSDLNHYDNKIVVDSWQNINKYTDLVGWFVIFDEQHAIANGSWTKSFLKITRRNRWIILTATPADSYMEYIPVFVANGFYKNRTEFIREHVIYARYSKFPKVDRYINTTRLERLRRKVTVEMDYKHEIRTHNEDVWCGYDISKYKTTMKTRWNPFKDEPMMNASELCYCLRRVVNEDISRQEEVKRIVNEKRHVIIFYSFDYELEILKNLDYGPKVKVAELNGHKHQDIPRGMDWVYLVNYSSGSEAWSCTKTDTIIFYSQTYSYKTLVQSKGRIDRLTTPFSDLYYYHLKSRSGIDLAISKALTQKKKFNERNFVKWD